MNRRAYSPTRKRIALRRCGWLAALVVLASVTGIYRFLPIQAVYMMADLIDIQHPQVVERFYDGSLPVTRFAAHYLVDGDDAMMLCVAGYHPLIGWYDRAWAKAETWDDAALHGGIYIHSQGDKRVCWLYGRVDNDTIQRLTLERTVKHHEEEGYTEAWNIPTEDIFEKGGKRYILMKLDMESMWDVGNTVHLIGYTSGGQIVKSSEIQARSWSTAG